LSELLLFVILGLGPGALIAGLATSLVLTFRGSGVINLAAGGVAVVGAFTFYGLRTGGYLWLVPFPGLPHQISLGSPWPTVPALLVAIAISALLGLVLDVAVFRPMRTTSPLGKLLASLGVLVVIQAAVSLRFGSNGQSAPAVFPDGAGDVVHVLGAQVPTDRLWLTGIVVALAGVLWAVYRFTRFGISSRAASENETLAMVLGMSPGRVSALNTVTACVVAGTLGALAAAQTQLDPVTIPLTVVPALAAVLIARFTSFGVAAAAGLGMGVIQSVVVYLQAQSWFPTSSGQPVPGVSDLVFFVILVVALAWRGKSLPQRGGAFERRLPRAPSSGRIALPAGGGLAICAIGFLVLPFALRQALTNTLIGVLICLSLVVITGFVGQISLVQVALSGVAGFVVSRLATSVHLGFPVGPILAIAIAVVLGMLAGAPALRVRGVNLAILTVAGAVALESFGFNNPVWGGGSSSLAVPQPHLFDISLGTNAPFPLNSSVPPSPVFGLLCTVVVVVVAAGVACLRRSDLGQRMLAVRSNERAAAAVGIGVRNTKLTAFAISSAIAGIAGVLSAYNYGSVSSTQFDIVLAFTFVSYAYVGGITTVLGAVVAGAGVTGGLLAYLLDDHLGISTEWQLLIGGLLLIVTIARQPDGIAGVLNRSRPALLLKRIGHAPPHAGPVPGVLLVESHS
jgi:branched-chain amino acid transport system permease protein